MKESLLNSTWNTLFNEFNILNAIKLNGSFEIKANNIKKYREPRLVTKFDSFEQMPTIFKQNNLGIFPISREAYIIGKYSLFYPIDQSIIGFSTINQKNNYESLDLSKIDSESEAIQIAYLNGILSDFINDNKIVPTFFGKKGVGMFDFKVKDKDGNVYPVKVDGGMMEVDSSFESDNNFIIVEAKKSLAKNFLIRQLYYPFRYFYPKISKKIRLVFLVHFEDKFNLYEYKFNDLNVYNSIELIKSKTYVLSAIGFQSNKLIETLKSTKIISEPSVPFPQADNMKRVFEICDYLSKHSFNKQNIKSDQNFHLRQVDYYLNAGVYLELILKEKKIYSLSLLGQELQIAPLKEKYMMIFKILCKHKVFSDIFKQLLLEGKELNRNLIIDNMDISKLYNVNKTSTLNRRISTVYSWIKEINDSVIINLN
jgi:hypothetical protein